MHPSSNNCHRKQNPSTDIFLDLIYKMFSFKLCRGEPAHMLVPSPFWVKPVSDHMKLKKLFDLNSETLIYLLGEILVVLKNN
jgi:hypothetical protein